MARVIFLSGHFRQAAAAVKAAIPDMNGKALRRRGFHIKELPSVTRNFWNGIGKNDNNCYNFANLVLLCRRNLISVLVRKEEV